jgi:hypothetical protein
MIHSEPKLDKHNLTLLSTQLNTTHAKQNTFSDFDWLLQKEHCLFPVYTVYILFVTLTGFFRRNTVCFQCIQFIYMYIPLVILTGFFRRNTVCFQCIQFIYIPLVILTGFFRRYTICFQCIQFIYL